MVTFRSFKHRDFLIYVVLEELFKKFASLGGVLGGSAGRFKFRRHDMVLPFISHDMWVMKKVLHNTESNRQTPRLTDVVKNTITTMPFGSTITIPLKDT